MDATREKQLNVLVGDAMAQPTAERHAFLQAAAEADPSLAREALSLIGIEEGLGGFLEEPAVEAMAGLRQIGPYRLVEKLGEGGMGRVYLAEQVEPVRRQVALKLMRSGLRSRQAAARFEVERQALARLSHPNIGQMHEAGTTEGGYPYFVMELVRGEPVTDFCDQRELTLEKRLALFCAVCHGVQHAHHKQILHRDLKPSNILIADTEGEPVPKIIDFGIAKALDEPLSQATLETRGGLIGTPSYMSPEALTRTGGEDDDLDTRTDVYSLGILLYELLTGVRPFESGNSDLPRILRRIAEEDAPRPSSRLSTLNEETRTGIARHRRTDADVLHRRLAGDLDWIVLKAIARDRQRRYGSPGEMAADIERYLRHEPVSARAPSRLYLAQKFVRRHRVWVGASALVLLALVLGLAGTLVGLKKAQRAEARALGEARTAEQVVDFLVEIFGVSSPDEARGATVTAREVLERGAEKVERELVDEPLIRARLLDTIGDVYSSLGLAADSELLLRQAATIRRREGAPTDQLADSLVSWSVAVRDQGRLEEAEDLLAQAYEVSAGPEGDEVMLSEVIHSQARVHSEMGRLQEARELYLLSIGMRERLLGEHPDLVNSLNNLGLVLTLLEDFEAAETYLKRAIEMRERLQGPDHPSLADSLSNLGGVYYHQGKYDLALPLLERDLEISKKVFPDAHPNLAISYNNVASLRQAVGDYRGSLEYFATALEMRQELHGPDHPETALVLANMGNVSMALGDLSDAEERYRRALEIGQRHQPDNLRNVRTLESLAHVTAARCDYDLARELYSKALGVIEQTAGPEYGRYTETLLSLAGLELLTEREERAASLTDRALRILEEKWGAGHPRTTRARLLRARLLARNGAPREARQELLELIGMPEREPAVGIGTLWLDLVRVESDLGLFEDARGRLVHLFEAAEREVAAKPEAFAPGVELDLAFLRAGTVHQGLGEVEKAHEAWRRALDLSQDLLKRSDRPQTRMLRAWALVLLGRIDEARPMIRELAEARCRYPELFDLATRAGRS